MNEDELIKKHKKEQKDLQAMITGLKKQANKKTRKQVNKKCAELEDNLKEKHEKELKELRIELGLESDNEEDEDEFSPEKLLAQLEFEKKEENSVKETPSQTQQQQPKQKRNRAKERIAKREHEIEKMKQEALIEASAQVDYGAIEKRNLDDLCTKLNLVQYDIKPDGNCLFSSIQDQLQYRYNISSDVQELRTKATTYIREHPGTFQPFLFDETTLTMGNIEEYCTKMEKSSEWGGDLEILALAKVYNYMISVVIGGQAIHKVNEDDQAKGELKLIYYKHVYGLGEHYNSLRDAEN